jgi:hypothetical protein
VWVSRRHKLKQALWVVCSNLGNKKGGVETQPDGATRCSFAHIVNPALSQPKMIIWLITLIYDKKRAAKEAREAKLKSLKTSSAPSIPTRDSSLPQYPPPPAMQIADTNNGRPPVMHKTLRHSGSWQKLE